MSDDVTAAPDVGQAAPAPAAAATPPVAPTAEGAAPANWFDGFANSELKGYIETKGFDGPEALANSYQNLEKLRGVPAEQLLQLPSDLSDANAMAPVYERLGRPETAEGYTNALGDSFDDGVFKNVAAQAHQLGLGDAQFQGLQKIMAEQSAAVLEAQEVETAEAFDKWKSENEQGFQNAAKVMSDVGMTEENLELLLSGDKTALYGFLAQIGARSGEPNVIQGESPRGEGFGMTPTAAKQKISELMADETFQRQYYSDNKKVRAEAISRMTALHEAAAKQG